MPPSLTSSLWDLPGPRQFLQKVVQDLLDGVSQMVLYPPSASLYGFKQELLRSIERDCCLGVRVVDSNTEGATDNSKDPFSIFCQVFPELIEYGNLERAMEAPCLPDVILVENLENCQTNIQVAWLQTLKRWGQVSQANDIRRSLLLLFPADAAARLSLPPADVRLSYLVWAGIPTALEVRLLCRMKTEGLDFEDQWREFMLASLAGNDIGLCEHLWDVIVCSKAEVFEALKSYAAKQGWDKEHIEVLLRRWYPKPPGLDLKIHPQETGFPLLSQGITMYTPEYGEEINSAVLAVLEQEGEMDHRIWRAQAALLLPSIDEVRRRICDHMTAQYGPDWAKTDEPGQTPLEWGELKIFFENLPRRLREKEQWGSGIKLAWRIRNQISHYNPIPYKDYRDFWNLSVSVRMSSHNKMGAK